jgi:hypothetical protein
VKFGIGIYFDGEKVLKMVLTLYPDPRGQGGPKQGLWGGWLSKKPFQKELAMHGLTFDPGQRRVLLLVIIIVGPCPKSEPHCLDIN